MLKKLTLLAMAVGALVAFAVPAAASAAELTDVNGEPVAVESTITATSTNTITVLGSGAVLECEHVKIAGIVTKNSGGEVTVTMDGPEADSATGCVVTTPSPVPAKVTPTFEHLHLDTAGGSYADFTFGVSIAGGPTCPESSKGAKVTWETGTDKIHVEGNVTGPIGCPGGKLSGDFTVTNSEGPVTID